MSNDSHQFFIETDTEFRRIICYSIDRDIDITRDYLFFGVIKCDDVSIIIVIEVILVDAE